MFFETIRMAFSNLVHNKMRTFLTVLGVIIGIASIISLMTLAQGATDMVAGNLVNAGANKLSTQVMGDGSKLGLSENDLLKIKEIDNVDYITANVSSRIPITFNGASYDRMTVKGIDGNFFRNASDDVLTEGRLIYEVDCQNMTKVCVLTSSLSQKLFGKMSPIGYSIQIKGISFVVVGVLDSTNSSVGMEDAVMIPQTTATNTLGFGAVKAFDVYLKDTAISGTTKAQIEDKLYTIFNENEDAYSVFDMQVIMDMFQTVMSTMNGLLTGIAAISLLVGGIGIMNMMLVSVSERTNEIGLRKALGAKPSIILLQFILEAVIIALAGGLIGVALGLAISSILGIALNVTPSVTFGIVALAVGFSAMVGLVFGIVPARRAAKLNPIDALRSN
ncbi:MAG: ABC transporter permease [Clostridia bacterium]